MEESYDLERFFSMITLDQLDQLKGQEIKEICAFLEEDLPVLLKKFPLRLVAHPRLARKCLTLCQWAMDKGFRQYQMAGCALHLRCILSVAEAKRLNLQSAQHELLLAAGMENEKAEASSLPDIDPFRRFLKNGQVMNSFLEPIFQAFLQGAEGQSEKLQAIMQNIEDLLFTISEDEKRSGVAKALFVVGNTNQGRLRNVLVKVTHRPESKPVEIKYSSLAREQVQPSLLNTANVAADVAHEFLAQQGYGEGLSGRIVEWQITLPTGRVEDHSVTYDGESLGLPLAAAIVSDYLGEPIAADSAFTGAFDILGRRESVILGVGGVPQKVNAALEAGIKRIYIPQINEDDLDLAAEKEAQRIHAEIILVHTFSQLAVHRLGLAGGQEAQPLPMILQNVLRSVPGFFRGVDENVPQ
ncbi:MAG: S16 family serine protease, partial [Candidatus Omnitrophota bacterium]